MISEHQIADIKTSTLLLLSEGTVFDTQMLAYLIKAGYQVSVASKVHTIEPGFLEADFEEADVILGRFHPGTSEIFTQMRAGNASAILVAIVEHMLWDSIDEQIDVDLILPASPAFISKQLTSYMNMRLGLQSQLSNLRQQNEQFASEIENIKRQNAELREQTEQLQEEVNRHKRTSNEIEVLKNAIVRNVSHELKTPLLQLKSAVALLSEDMKDSIIATYAQNATARLESHIRNITMLGTSFENNRGPLIMRDVIEYARRNLTRIWEMRDAVERVQIELTDNLPPVLGDKQGLSTVLQLLMDNALKFSTEYVFVRGTLEDDYVVIAISDSGIGIQSEKVKEIFDLFYQVDNSSTRRYGGAGVGLALVKLILDYHETDIEVISTPDKGSTFRFRLPIVSLNSDSLL